MAHTPERPVAGSAGVIDDDKVGADWRQLASCRSCNPDLFFPSGTTGAAVPEIAAAKAVCMQCPVRWQCLGFALRTGQAYGIWGGATEDERLSLRRLARRRRMAWALPA